MDLIPGFDPQNSAPRSAYIHIPFCLSKCIYCDFSSFAGMGDLFNAYVRALIRDIKLSADGPALESVFFGGGTPTILGETRLRRVLDAVIDKFGFGRSAEISVEANPGTVGRETAAELVDAGFNRLSLGVQSFDDSLLGVLGRAHSAREAVEAIANARSAGFANLNIDLMYGLPGQSIKQWESDLHQIVGLGCEHVSAYELTVEEHTPLHKMVEEGKLSIACERLQIEMWLAAQSILDNAGLERYEVSNYARTGYKCRHNLVYWHNLPYWGFGAGAVEYVDGVRSMRTKNPEHYILGLQAGVAPLESSEQVSERTRQAETIMLGLRLTEGIELSVVEAMFGDIQRIAQDLKVENLLVVDKGRLKVSEESTLLLNDIVLRFL